MEKAIEVFALVHLGLMGLSHLLRPGDWVDFFTRLREKGHTGVFLHGFLSLGFGSMVLAFHDVWSGVPAVLTYAGVAYLFKAFLCFLFPGLAFRSLERVSHERAWELRLAGVLFLGLGASVAYSLLLARN